MAHLVHNHRVHTGIMSGRTVGDDLFFFGQVQRPFITFNEIRSGNIDGAGYMLLGLAFRALHAY